MNMAISSSGVATQPPVTSGASLRMPPSQKMNTLFQKIDGAGTGSISQQQFTQAFNTLNPPAGFKAMGASTVFSQLDPNGTGSVSKQDFVSGMTNLMGKVRHHHGASTTGASTTGVATPAQSLASSAQSLNALSGQSSVAATGSSTSASVNTLV